MTIGQRLLTGDPIYTTNSYYPMPFVIIFSLFASIPRPLSMALWFLIPVICAWAISGRNPLVLLFAPLFGHFAGGQSSVFGLLGLWGYRKYKQVDKPIGGVYLALTLIKPQLGLVPFAYALIQWISAIRLKKSMPSQAWGCVITLAILFIPGYFIDINWVSKWLSSPRPIFERAISGFVPRILLYFVEEGTQTYWIILVFISLLLLLYIFYRLKGKITLDLIVVWGFIINPLVHDYDLIQLVPVLDSPKKQKWGVLLSLPGWLVIIFAYANDQAWFVFSLIAPGLLLLFLFSDRQENKKVMPEEPKYKSQ